MSSPRMTATRVARRTPMTWVRKMIHEADVRTILINTRVSKNQLEIRKLAYKFNFCLTKPQMLGTIVGSNVSKIPILQKPVSFAPFICSTVTPRARPDRNQRFSPCSVKSLE